MLADKLASERKIRRTLQKRLTEKEDEIEALKEQQKITEEQYQKQLQALYQSQENNEKLISYCKSDHYLGRNSIKVMLAISAFNLKRSMRLLLCLVRRQKLWL